MEKNNAPAVIFGVIALVVVLVLIFGGCFYVVEPGNRGVKITLGKVAEHPLPEGWGLKAPLVTDVKTVSIRQTTQEVKAECYSSDLQQVNINLRILYSIKPDSVVKIYQLYQGDPFESLIAPRVLEAVKERTALTSAEQIVKNREEIKRSSLSAAQAKVGQLINLDDLVIENITLSKELEAAIEEKMVQEQEASKARFTQDKARIEAETRNIQAEIEAKATITKAKAEAESIRIRGEALKQNPDLIQLQIVEKWNGVAPLVIGGGQSGGAGSTMILPITPQPQPQGN
jgi:prohibitin 2